MAIPDWMKHNFSMVQRAFENNDVALVECPTRDGNLAYVLCATQEYPDGSIALIPFAKLFDGNPYDELHPPTGTAPTELLS